MSVINIYSDAEIRQFDSPPIFSGEERKKYFRVNKQLSTILAKQRTFHSRVGFLLHLGYFRKMGRFYSAQKYHDHDLKYILNLLNIKEQELDMTKYHRRVFDRQKKAILNYLGFSAFSVFEQQFLIQIRHLVRHREQPKSIVAYMQYWCKLKKTEMCSYYYIAYHITNEINHFEEGLCNLLEQKISDNDKKLLDQLTNDPLIEDRFPLHQLKKIIQEEKPKKIKESLIEFLKIRQYYQKLKLYIILLDLPINSFKSFGVWVSKATKFQINRLHNQYLRYLYVISFIHYQFHLWQDAYTTILLNATNSFIRRSKKAAENSSDDRQKKEELSTTTQDKSYEKSLWLATVGIIEDDRLGFEEKLDRINQMAIEYRQKSDAQNLDSENENTEIKDYFYFLTGNYQKLHNKVSGIIKALVLDEQSSDKVLMEAIDTYKKYDRIIKPEPFIALFSEVEQDAVKRNEKFNTRLCKALFYGKVADGIRAGALNLKYSYKYLTVENYLIDPVRWEKEKNSLIERAGLSSFQDISNLLHQLKEVLHQTYQESHEKFVSGNNPYLKYKKDKKPKVETPPTAPKDNKRMAELFEDTQYVLLPHILSDIEDTTKFLDAFEHYNIKHKRKKPNKNVFLAGLLGYGCNLGAGKIGQIVKGVEGHAISNTLRWYFSLSNVLKANDRIVDMIDKLAISSVFRKNRKIKHTASDGQKFNVAVPSLQATYSVKYFGTGKGVSVYSFIDDKFALFYNTVFSSSEREATYVIDGLLHNDVDRNDQNTEWRHSTDTHGYTELIFGATHLLNTSFAPRIKNYSKQIIYGFESPSYYKRLGYFWLPSRKINTELIEEQWDNILRLIATIRLKEATASNVFRRLSSYAKQNPLYQALKEFGRIIKTIFLLQYINEVELRQQIEYQLNVVELSHKFADAVFFGRSGEFYEASEELQKVVAACRVLIQNAIILWNYLYISKKILACKTDNELEKVFSVLKEGSMITWRHIHMQGTYNFEEEFMSNFSPVNIAKMLDMDFQDFLLVKG